VRVLITGASGMLGHRLAIQAIKEGFETLGTYHQRRVKIKKAKTLPLDITSFNSVKKVFEDFQPQIVIHTAALTNVDLCEEKPEEAYKINALGSKNIASLCAERKAKLIYISTDYVFDGEKGSYTETDKPYPLGVYARTKLEGEKEVSWLTEALIFRCTIYGWHLDEQKSIPEWVIDNLQKKSKIRAFTDRIISPIYTGNLAEILFEALKKNLNGVYHLGSKRPVSIFNFALKIAEIYNLDKSLIEEGKMEDFAFKARRPKDSSLCVNKIERALGKDMPGIEEGLKKMKKEKELAKEWIG